MKKIKLCLLFFFAALISLPAIFFNPTKEYISEIDNRTLAEFPTSFKLSTGLFNDIYRYLDDRFGGREAFVTSYVYLNDRLFNELVHPTYAYGQEKYVFFGLGDERYYSEYEQDFAEAIDKIQEYVESKGAKFYMVINPEKTSVYTQYLPKGVHYNRNWILDFEQELDRRGVTYIDNTEELRARSQEIVVYDKQYDAGHWNDLGAFYGVNHLLRLIEQDFPTVTPLQMDEFDLSYEEHLTLKTSKFPIDDFSPVLTYKYPENFDDISGEYSDIILDEQYPTFSYITNYSKNSSELPVALVFQGSYLNGRTKFLMSRFSDYIAVHNYQNIFNVDYYFDEFHPDIVVFEVAEYTFSDWYFSQEAMKNLDLK